MQTQHLLIGVAITSTFAIALTATPSQALTWTFNSGSEVLTTPSVPITGFFTINDENLANPVVTRSSISWRGDKTG